MKTQTINKKTLKRYKDLLKRFKEFSYDIETGEVISAIDNKGKLHTINDIRYEKFLY